MVHLVVFVLYYCSMWGVPPSWHLKRLKHTINKRESAVAATSMQNCRLQILSTDPWTDQILNQPTEQTIELQVAVKKYILALFYQEGLRVLFHVVRSNFVLDEGVSA